MGELAMKRGEFEVAQERFARALPISCEAGDASNELHLHIGVGRCALEVGREVEAHAAFERACACARPMVRSRASIDARTLIAFAEELGVDIPPGTFAD